MNHNKSAWETQQMAIPALAILSHWSNKPETNLFPKYTSVNTKYPASTARGQSVEYEANI